MSKKKKEEAAERVLVGMPNEAEEEAGLVEAALDGPLEVTGPVEAALKTAEAAEAAEVEETCGAAVP
ncbi:hypothetical protein RF55_19566 [Lasius niger]|uniref:Uncharacterized protein n=1 Tax=Lasius niger TaxID=67767 RepID=A0A0J7MSY0_LASNI|nr:hypothetical protein RF55_19566 [Lasius niger]